MPAQSLNQHVVETLGLAIVGGETAPGEIIRLDQIQERFSVSRTVARDAVKALEAQHLVQARRRIGTVVLPADQWDVLAPTVIRWRLAGPQRMQALAEISELRLGIEPTAAALAATRATQQECFTLEGAVLGMMQTARIPDLETYLQHDIVFHRTLLQSSHNPMLATLGYVVEEVLSGRTHRGLMPPTPKAEAIQLHRDVVAAIVARDAAAAERCMRDIVAEALVGAEEMDRGYRDADLVPAPPPGHPQPRL